MRVDANICSVGVGPSERSSKGCKPFPFGGFTIWGDVCDDIGSGGDADVGIHRMAAGEAVAERNGEKL